MKWRPILFGIIIIICIVSINYAIYWMMKQDIPEPTPEPDPVPLSNQFNSIFDNTMDEQGYAVGTTVAKKEADKALIYTGIEEKEKVAGEYEVNVSIPVINISKTSVDDINEQIEKTFYSKVLALKSAANAENRNQLKVQNNLNTTIYTVQYKAYINSNILSLVIKATLKEGVNEQRVMVKTYNYNLTTNEEIKLNQLKEIKGITTQQITEQIQKTIAQANEQARNLESLGYTVLYRTPTDDIYNIETSNESINCFLGEQGRLYIIYPYGNRENTSEMDIIVFE